MLDPFGVGKKIVDLEKFLVTERGKYTVDVFEKVAEDKVKFIQTAESIYSRLSTSRRFSDEEIAKILATDGVIEKLLKLNLNLLE